MQSRFRSLSCSHGGGLTSDAEADVRGTYCALAVAHLAGSPHAPQLAEGCAGYIRSLQTYEGGFGGEPMSEAHAAFSYCAVAALRLLGSGDWDRPALLRWAARRQLPLEGGLNGRAGKLVVS
jgi:protein farnesyltransferase subunit beta